MATNPPRVQLKRENDDFGLARQQARLSHSPHSVSRARAIAYSYVPYLYSTVHPYVSTAQRYFNSNIPPFDRLSLRFLFRFCSVSVTATLFHYILLFKEKSEGI